VIALNFERDLLEGVEMKRELKRETINCFYFVDGVKNIGAPVGLRGDVSGLRGDVSGLRGDASGLSGDLDSCELTEEDRALGILITDLIGE